MRNNQKTGAQQLAEYLEKRHIDHVFGIPGSRDLALYEAIDHAQIRIVLAVHEQGAAFMAIGWARTRRSPAVLTVIAGPGFTNALTALAEAYFDAVPLICLLVKPPALPDCLFQFQRIDERTIARQFLKAIFTIEKTSSLTTQMEEAFQTAISGTPGPVLVEISSPVLLQRSKPQAKSLNIGSKPVSKLDILASDEVHHRIVSARKPVLFLGARAELAAEFLPEFIERLGSPVFVFPEARGLLPENHDLYMGGDFTRTPVGEVNALLEESDLALALGCRFTQTCTAGYRLKMPSDRSILIESEIGSRPKNQTFLSLPCDTVGFIRDLQKRNLLAARTSGWKAKELAEWRDRLLKVPRRRFLEPGFRGLRPPRAHSFFRILREQMPDSFRLVTDSGLHQLLARRWHEARTPGSLLIPHEYQSMGYGVPVSIGAALADPERPIMAIVGNGGFAMTGMELGTAVQEGLSIMVAVFNDNHLGVIRLAQLKTWGRSFATRTPSLDLASFALAIGAEYHRLNHDLNKILSRCREGGVHLIEVTLRDNLDIRLTRIKGKLKNRFSS
jgi:acetolactate synthase-1/2/3 large subunit